MLVRLASRKLANESARMRHCIFLTLALALCLGVIATWSSTQPLAQDNGDLRPPTVDEYVASIGEEAQIVPSGQLKLGGVRVRCGQRPTVLDPTLDDYGAAFPSFIILHPKRIAALPPAVQLWIYSHECAHQFRGPNEEVADCFAVQRGRRRKWLSPEGMDEICKFISPAKGSSQHYSGVQRCEIMRQCYGSKRIY